MLLPGYPLWLLMFVILPVAVFYALNYKLLSRYNKVFLKMLPVIFLIGYTWDISCVKLGIWYFKRPYIFGLWFLGLPIEEWLFFVFVSWGFAMATIYIWHKWGVKE